MSKVKYCYLFNVSITEMGYDTMFQGFFRFNKPLSSAHRKYLLKFSEMRRMKRNNDVLAAVSDPLRMAVNLPLGTEGEYFVNGKGFAGQDHDESILDHNTPPGKQPGLWCQWVPNRNGTIFRWNGTEKFYNYIEWLRYLIENFIKPWGYVLNGKVKWQGEHPGDFGTISVADNIVTIVH